MRKAGLILAAAALIALPALADTQTFSDVSLVDVNCSKKVADNPDAHTRDCAIKCDKSGYGVITSDKKFIKFDEAGNKQVEAALKASDKKDHLRVDVTGDVTGDSMKVTSVTLK